MAENFQSYYSNLKSWVPKIPLELCKFLVNRARRDIYESRIWSFLLVESQITCPAIINSGGATFTQYSRTVVGDATASAAWTGVANPVITMRQIRQSGGPVYSIVAADFTNPAAVALTLDRPFQETTVAGTGYVLYQCYYPPTDPITNAPTADFVKWITVWDPVNGFRLKLNYTQEWLNRVDPLRANMGQAYRVASYRTIKNSAGDNVEYYEFWPAPTDGKSRKCLYKIGQLDWTSSSDRLPVELPTELLEVRARYRAYEWAQANAGTHPELQKTNWLAMRQALMDPRDRASYPYLMAKAKAEDENRYAINFVDRPEFGWRYPIDADFLQSHAFSYEFPGEFGP